MHPTKKHLSSSQIIILGFAGIILLGSFLLTLPVSTQNGERADFGSALFTATSAVCVTGLIVQDTATYWSVFGQSVILFLIQIGGMGIVTVAAAITLISGKRISLKQRSTMQDAIGAHHVGGIVRLTGFILRTTLCIELLGAALMAPTFCRQFGPWKGIWFALFHSISAFCNAGFDLMGITGAYSSLTSVHANIPINIAIMSLIVIGGIGFLTWDDIRTHHIHLRKYRMQSKVILSGTALLILLPALYFFFFEFQDEPFKVRILQSFFQSITPRTAGFNTVDLTLLNGRSHALMIVLMLIGGAPGSTAGGMKTTTLVVLLSTMVAVFRRDEHTNLFGRRISESTVRHTVAILSIYLLLFFSGGFLISHLEQLPLSLCLFETASAIGTVGLTLGITPQLGTLSRCIVILLMYVGRVGGLTLVFSALTPQQPTISKLPQEKLTVG